MAIYGNYIVVGADGENTANIFKIKSNVSVTELYKFQGNNKSRRDNFGESVAIYGDYIVVGAHYEDTGGSNAGAAYLFKINSNGSVTEVAKFQGHDTSRKDYFGRSVAIYGDYIVVGATEKSTGGAAYLFKIKYNG